MNNRPGSVLCIQANGLLWGIVKLAEDDLRTGRYTVVRGTDGARIRHRYWMHAFHVAVIPNGVIFSTRASGDAARCGAGCTRAGRGT